MIHSDRPLRAESRPQGGVQLQVAQPDRAQAEALRLHLRGDPLDEVVQVHGPMSRVDDRQPDAVGRQLAERLAQRLGDTWQDDPSQALRGGHQQAMSGDAVRAVGQMIGVIFECAERDPRHRRPLQRRGDLRRPEALQTDLGRGHRVLLPSVDQEATIDIRHLARDVASM